MLGLGFGLALSSDPGLMASGIRVSVGHGSHTMTLYGTMEKKIGTTKS